MTDPAGEITALLGRLNQSDGDGRVLDELIPIVYSELKALARANRYRWGGKSNLHTTSLVHEAYYKLARLEGAEFQNSRQFFYIASRAMRTLLIDNARRQQRLKRGGGSRRVPLDVAALVSLERSEELLALEEALVRLERENVDLARLVECRTFGGLTLEETAQALDISPTTVKRKWRLARAWLFRELRGTSGERLASRA